MWLAGEKVWDEMGLVWFGAGVGCGKRKKPILDGWRRRRRSSGRKWAPAGGGWQPARRGCEAATLLFLCPRLLSTLQSPF